MPCSGASLREHTAQFGEIAGRQYRSPQRACADVWTSAFAASGPSFRIPGKRRKGAFYDAQTSLLVTPTFVKSIHDLTTDPNPSCSLQRLLRHGRG